MGPLNKYTKEENVLCKHLSGTWIWIWKDLELRRRYFSSTQFGTCLRFTSLWQYSEMSPGEFMSPCFNVQKALYFSHTACAAAPLFTLCLKPQPSLHWLVSWQALLWLVNRLEMSRCYMTMHAAVKYFVFSIYTQICQLQGKHCLPSIWQLLVVAQSRLMFWFETAVCNCSHPQQPWAFSPKNSAYV